MFEKDDKKHTGEINGFIGKGMMMDGRLTFEGAVRIDGAFKGEIASSGILMVGDEGLVEANVKVDTAIITGEVRGMVEAKTRVELSAPARMLGDIKTPSLIIGDGVIFEGKCTMTKQDAREHDNAQAALPGGELKAL